MLCDKCKAMLEKCLKNTKQKRSIFSIFRKPNYATSIPGGGSNNRVEERTGPATGSAAPPFGHVGDDALRDGGERGHPNFVADGGAGWSGGLVGRA